MSFTALLTKTGQVIFVDGNTQLDEAYNFAKDGAEYGLFWLDQLEPVARAYTDAQTWADIVQSLDNGQITETAKNVISTMVGGFAAQ